MQQFFDQVRNPKVAHEDNTCKRLVNRFLISGVALESGPGTTRRDGVRYAKRCSHEEKLSAAEGGKRKERPA
jgi:hypothetical protein